MKHHTTNNSGRRQSQSYQSGQILLLLVLVIGTLIIVAMTAIYQTSDQANISASNQSADRTIAAAESALEYALANTDEIQGFGALTFEDLGLDVYQGIDLRNSRIEVKADNFAEITGIKVEDGQQHTLYMADYNLSDGSLGATYQMGFQIYYEPVGSCEDTVLEITLVHDQDADGRLEIASRVADAGGQFESTLSSKNMYDDSDASQLEENQAYHLSDGTTARCKTTAIVSSEDENCTDGMYFGPSSRYGCLSDVEQFANLKLVIVRSLFTNNTISYSSAGNFSIGPPGENFDYAFEDRNGNRREFPSQGRTITAVARSQPLTFPTLEDQPGVTITPPRSGSGLTRVAELYQSYPQLPADLFVTGFGSYVGDN